MAFYNIKGIIDAELSGKVRRNTWRKAPTQATTVGVWFDLSMSPGNPPPKYWFDASPGIAVQIKRSTDGGLDHGPNVSPSTKYLRMMTTNAYVSATGLPMQIMLCDYLLYYPSIDESTTGEQLLTNNVTLPRYETGEGVQMICVNVAARTGGQDFTINYTNSSGVAGRTSAQLTNSALPGIGLISTSYNASARSTNPFVGLQDGDTGVRSVESVNIIGADVGLFSIVLVKPLASTMIAETTAPYEKDFWIQDSSMPIIKDDAFLGMLCLPSNTIQNQVYAGDIKVIWD